MSLHIIWAENTIWIEPIKNEQSLNSYKRRPVSTINMFLCIDSEKTAVRWCDELFSNFNCGFVVAISKSITWILREVSYEVRFLNFFEFESKFNSWIDILHCFNIVDLFFVAGYHSREYRKPLIGFHHGSLQQQSCQAAWWIRLSLQFDQFKCLKQFSCGVSVDLINFCLWLFPKT